MVNTPLPDLEIRIFPRSESGYPIHLRLSDGQDFAGNLAADLADWTPTGNPQADGRALFEALFAVPKLREAWGLARGAEQRRIRLWLDADAPELHFVGHGAFSERRQEAALYLQDAAGNTQIVTDAQLCEMLRRRGTLPSLIFLAACQSAERSPVDAFAGLAPRLVPAGISAVVAMQDKVALAATRKLTPVFYEELARHGEVDRALNAARSRLLTGQSPDVATPVVLLARTGVGM